MLKGKPLARIGQQNRPLNMAFSKSFLGHVFDFQVQLVILLNGASVLESGAQLVAQMVEH